MYTQPSLFNYFNSPKIVVCCEFWRANASLCMSLHGWKHWKILKNSQNITFFIVDMRGSHMAHVEKMFFGERLGVTPNCRLTPKCWLLIWNFVLNWFSTWALHEHNERGTVLQPLSVFILFDQANACTSMPVWSKYTSVVKHLNFIKKQ